MSSLFLCCRVNYVCYESFSEKVTSNKHQKLYYQVVVKKTIHSKFSIIVPMVDMSTKLTIFSFKLSQNFTYFQLQEWVVCEKLQKRTLFNGQDSLWYLVFHDIHVFNSTGIQSGHSVQQGRLVPHGHVRAASGSGVSVLQLRHRPELRLRPGRPHTVHHLHLLADDVTRSLYRFVETRKDCGWKKKWKFLYFKY